jgi:hypothetical protein
MRSESLWQSLKGAPEAKRMFLSAVSEHDPMRGHASGTIGLMTRTPGSITPSPLVRHAAFGHLGGRIGPQATEAGGRSGLSHSRCRLAPLPRPP